MQSVNQVHARNCKKKKNNRDPQLNRNIVSIQKALLRMFSSKTLADSFDV